MSLVTNGSLKFVILQIAEPAAADSTYNAEKLTIDEHCFECKVKFRDPRPKDLMMFLHAWRYKVMTTDYDCSFA